MPVLTLLFVFAVAALIVYLIETYIPMSPPLKLVFQALVVLLAIVWLLQAVGVISPVLRLT